ncbi:hypothetical protein DJ77_05310 [Halorubrum ezzemoulense]|nr:hypothetical protein DJ77_05310 [Halorubrum ezzemoulense]
MARGRRRARLRERETTFGRARRCQRTGRRWAAGRLGRLLTASDPQRGGVVEGFPRTFRAAEWILTGEGPLATGRRGRSSGARRRAGHPRSRRLWGAETPARRALVGREMIALIRHGSDRADPVVRHVSAVDAEAVSRRRPRTPRIAGRRRLRAPRINPGTTADLTCAALFVALRRGAEVAP